MRNKVAPGQNMASFILLFEILAYLMCVASQGPAAVPGEGLFAGLSPNAATFKEEDYLTALAERQRYTDVSDFVYNFPAQEGAKMSGPGGGALQITLDQKPSLARTGAMSQEVFTLNPCGLNGPHYHMRAAKVLYVLQGQINVGFVEEGTRPRTFAANLTVGQSITIPQGLAMWVHNLNCTTAQFLDTWANSDPGTLGMVPALLQMPLPTLAAAFGIDTVTAEAMVSNFKTAIPQGPQECLQRCNVSATGLASGPVSSPAGGPSAVAKAAPVFATVTEPSTGNQTTLVAG